MFTIPNEDECAYTVTAGGVTFAPQATPDRGDVDILVAGQDGTGVVSGCAVTALATPDGTVAVAAGIVAVANRPVAVAVSTVNVLSGPGSTAAHATLPRLDLVVISSAGVASVVAGNAAAAPKYPAIPAASAVAAAVYVPAAATTIGTDQLVDKRVPVVIGPRDRAWVGAVAPHPDGDEFNDGVLDPAWTSVVPSGTMVVDEGADVLSVKVKGQTGEHAACLLKALPAGFGFGNYIETAMRATTMQNYVMFGLVFSDGVAATSNVVWQMPFLYTSSAPYAMFSARRGAMNGSKTIFTDLSANHVGRGVLYQRLTWVAADTWRFEWSVDGVSWTDFGQGNKTFALTPTHIGMGFSTWGGVQDSLVAAEYFRVG